MARHPRVRRSATRTILAAAIEPLEQRQLLTRIVGGQTFVFADDQGNSTVVRATGDIVVDLVGAVFNSERDVDEGEDPADFARLGDIPGFILGDDGSFSEVRGGYGGPPPADPDEEDTNPIWSGLWGIFATSNSPDATLTITRGEAFYSPIAERVRFTNVTPFESPDAIALNAEQDLGLGQSSGTSFLGLRRDDGSVIRTRNANIYDGARPPAFNLSGFILPVIQIEGPLARFFFAGTITGRAIFNGGVQNFYAGNLLTGLINGESRRNPAPNDNFSVIGDVGQFTVNGYIGTGDYEPLVPGDIFKTGTDIAVNGRIGSLYVANDMRAKLDVVGTVPTTSMTSGQIELEGTVQQTATVGDGGLGNAFMEGQLGADNLKNDNLANAQPIFTSFNPDISRGNSAVITGSLFPGPDFNDAIDHYAIPLLGGQTATIQIAPTGLLPVNVGVYDPLGRLVASDRSNLETADNTNRAFRVVADIPGIYTIAAAVGADLNFNGQEDDALLFTPFSHPYELRVTRTSEASIGLVRVVGNVYADREIPEDPDVKEQPPIRLRNGDLGGFWIGGDFHARRNGTLEVQKGNVRVIDAANIGLLDPIEGFESLNLNVPLGHVGLVRARGNLMWLNNRALKTNGLPEPSLAIGGSYQMVDVAGGIFVGHLTANKGIGTLRANQIGNLIGTTPSFFAVDVDRSGGDGFIDLVDVAGDLGNVIAGGPAFDAGPGGNIRYIRVGGQAYRDAFFGGGLPEQTTYQPRRTVSLFDDSGTRVLLTPIRYVDRTSNPSTPTPIVDGQLTLETLPVRSGGSVILRLQTTQSVRIESNREGSGVEIGRLILGGNASPLTDNPTTGLTYPTGGPILDLESTGSMPVGVLQLTAGNLRNLSMPNGEIVLASLTDVDTLSLSNIGTPRTNSGAALRPLGTIGSGNTYPFSQQSVGINVRSVKNLTAANGIGNVVASGTIQNVLPNSDGKFTKGVDEGITGPIVVSGQLRNVNIGEGILPSGTGGFSRAGLYANGKIVSVVNSVPGTDVRGDIVSLTGIDSISLNGGSIVDADILVNVPFTTGLELAPLPIPPERVDTLNRPDFTLKSISVTSGAGIIGAAIVASNVQDVVVSGFGQINSRVLVSGSGTVNKVSTDGLGLRGMDLRGGAAIVDVLAAGTTGKVLDLRDFSSTVRFSNVSAFDPFSGISVNPANDLNAYLGTGLRSPKVDGVTNEGVIRNSLLAGSRSLGSVTAYQIDVNADNELPPSDPLFPMRMSFGNRIGAIFTHGNIAGLQVTAGGLDSLSVGKELSNSSFTFSGRVRSIVVTGSIRGSTTISARGSQGIIDTLVTKRSLFGDIAATRFGTVRTGRDLGTGRLRSFGNMNVLEVGGNVLLGAYVRATGTLADLWIKGNFQLGSTIRAAAFGTVRIDGVNAGDLVVG
jgi:hypothetical protein